ncbi:MAG: hypothetical protein RMJ43_12645, partial [Chloroherpetonaceae bacterium]|nr:hypothetical protein [Chthonomonadaceae bacterium]MDW8208678.1 hypothetical protein [Chloroherpetonaceae bacterium]
AVMAGIALWFGRPAPTVPVAETGSSGSVPHRVVNHVDEIRNMGMPETELLLEQTLSSRQMGLAALTEGESL